MKAALGALLILLATSAAATPFDNILGGGRSAALGGMLGCSETGPTCALTNPAALAFLPGNAFQAAGRTWYETELVRSATVAWARPVGNGGVGVAWHRFGQSDLWTEDLMVFGGGWTLRETMTGARLAIGGNLKALQVAAPGYEGDDYQGAFRSWAADLAVFVEPFPFLRLSRIEENLGCGEITLLDGGNRWRAAPRRSRSGCSFTWRDDLVIGGEWVSRPGRAGEMLFGAELSFYRAFTVRGGAGSRLAAAGFGLSAQMWSLDLAFETRRELGSSLILSFTRLLGGKEQTP